MTVFGEGWFSSGASLNTSSAALSQSANFYDTAGDGSFFSDGWFSSGAKLGGAAPVGSSGGYLDGWQDTVGGLLGIWGRYETQRLNNRLAETQIQASLLEQTAKYSNPQAASTMTGAADVLKNPAVIVGGLLLLAGVVYLAVRR